MFFLGFMLYLPAQEGTSLKKGLVVDTLRCAQESSHSYAYYLPTDYDAKRTWPIIYIFEPAARGALPVDSFRMAAEKYGYILVGSNNSRNGAWEAMFEAADYLFADVERRFSVDLNRRYTAGFSGGSRMAVAAAALTGKVAGVIGCGAAAPNNPAYSATEKSDFAYYGLVGDRDMNFQEMYLWEDQLLAWELPVRLRVFPAGHQWPSPDLLTEALAWLNVQAMKRGSMDMDAEFMEEQEQALLNAIETLRTNKSWYSLARHYQYFLQDFEEEAESVGLELKTLKASAAYTKSVENWAALRDQEFAQRGKLTEDIIRLEWQKGLKDSLRRVWKKEVSQLRQQIKKAPELESQMAARTLNLLTAQCIEMGWERMSRQEFANAIQLFKLWTIIEPEKSWAYYNLAKAQAMAGKKKAAIKSIEKALEYGLKQSMLTKDSAFDKIRNSKKFKKLLAN